RLTDASKNDFIDQRRIKPGSRQQIIYRDPSQFVRRHARQVSTHLAERSADSVHDYQPLVVHGFASKSADAPAVRVVIRAAGTPPEAAGSPRFGLRSTIFCS